MEIALTNADARSAVSGSAHNLLNGGVVLLALMLQGFCSVIRFCRGRPPDLRRLVGEAVRAAIIN